jgi:hypothetical protein
LEPQSPLSPQWLPSGQRAPVVAHAGFWQTMFRQMVEPHWLPLVHGIPSLQKKEQAAPPESCPPLLVPELLPPLELLALDPPVLLPLPELLALDPPVLPPLPELLALDPPELLPLPELPALDPPELLPLPELPALDPPELLPLPELPALDPPELLPLPLLDWGGGVPSCSTAPASPPSTGSNLSKLRAHEARSKPPTAAPVAVREPFMAYLASFRRPSTRALASETNRAN